MDKPPFRPSGRPTLDDFWKRLDARKLEPGLRAQLRERTAREDGDVRRVGRAVTVEAVAARILPGIHVPHRALAVFLDETFDRQMGRGDEPAGKLPRDQAIPAGFVALDEAAGGDFSTLAGADQDALLERAEAGQLPGPEGFDSAGWFSNVREYLLLAFGSDPRGMIFMGYPGPSYEPGHVWLGLDEVQRREEQRPGYRQL